jgi:hypothetical protein
VVSFNGKAGRGGRASLLGEDRARPLTFAESAAGRRSLGAWGRVGLAERPVWLLGMTEGRAVALTEGLRATARRWR